jgi:ferredoxin
MRSAVADNVLASAMANPNDRVPENQTGKYYVDASCIDCDQCRSLAPGLFSRNSDTGLTFLSRQPATHDEIALFEEAASSCATSSIGNDGA